MSTRFHDGNERYQSVRCGTLPIATHKATTTTGIASDVFRISTCVPAAELQFNQFRVRDEGPLLYHNGQNTLFGDVQPAVRTLIDVSRLRWICFSHFESDEYGSLNR